MLIYYKFKFINNKINIYYKNNIKIVSKSLIIFIIKILNKNFLLIIFLTFFIIIYFLINNLIFYSFILCLFNTKKTLFLMFKYVILN